MMAALHPTLAMASLPGWSIGSLSQAPSLLARFTV